MKAKTENQRIARLALQLSQYWYNIQHAAGDSMLMQIADALSRLAMSLIDETEDHEGPVDCPFDGAEIQNILLQCIGSDVILSPARFSNNTDTYARLTRSTAEVVPNSIATEFTTNSTHSDRCGCLCCTGQVLALEEMEVKEGWRYP